MVSPALNAPKRSEAEAMFDVEDRRHRLDLRRILEWLHDSQASVAWTQSMDYAIEQLDKHAAARILERNKRDG